ncbi:MAG: DUF11 domain-containing protein [Deltaproteobacteria bacterium]|nr:DUF11 domain-containing protein [Deltaproteobacteria bacterium]
MYNDLCLNGIANFFNVTIGSGNIYDHPDFINNFLFADLTSQLGTVSTIFVRNTSIYEAGNNIEYDNDGIMREIIFIDTEKILFTPALPSISEANKFIYYWGAKTDPAEDFHLKQDSPCIDAGDPTDSYSDEPLPNGGVINIGAYGGTTEATTSPVVDSDGDGLPDSLENTTCTDPFDADTDDDGIPDGVEDGNQNGDFDPGETHPCKIDTDGDGLQDGTELGYTLGDIGPDTDLNKFQSDLDPTSTTDALDPDSDGDRIRDGVEDANHNGRFDEGETNPGIYTPNADISVEKSADIPKPYIGDNVVFTITVTNNGPNDATSVQVTDQLPAGLTYVADDSDGAYASGTGKWDVGNLADGDTSTLEITTTVDQAGRFTNMAIRTESSPLDANEGNDSDDTVVNTGGKAMPWLLLLLGD